MRALVGLKTFSIFKFIDVVFWRLMFLLALLPLSGGVQISGKPLDLVMIDLIVFLSWVWLLIYIIDNKISIRDSQILFFPPAIVFLFGFFTTVNYIFGMGSEIVFLSLIKFYKAFFAVSVGYYCSKRLSIREFLLILGWSSAALSVLLALDQFFVRADFLPRWGEKILGFDVYGFPNSSASFYIIPLAGLVSCWHVTGRNIFLLFAAGLAAFMIFSLSRSAFIVLTLFGLLSILFSSTQKKIIFLCLLGVVFFVITSVIPDSGFDSLINRLVRISMDDDPSNGRFEIWTRALELFFEKPIIGYLFESFSSFHEFHDTPHSQYIEVLFKTGVIGFLLYFGYLFYIAISIHMMRHRVSDKGERAALNTILGAILILLIGAATQPNISYSVSGSWVFVLLSFFFFSVSSYKSFDAVVERIDMGRTK